MVSPHKAAIQIKNFISCKPIIVGHNLSLDKYMIDRLLKQFGYNLDDLISHRSIDTMSLLWNLFLRNEIPLEACSSKGLFNTSK